MRPSLLASLLVAGLATPALAAEPNGEWLVKDGTARIRIEPCVNGAGGALPQPAGPTALQGNISWTKNPGGTDSNNPDPAKRGRPILGVPILLEMKQTTPDRWEGKVYNAQNGKFYDSSVTLVSDDQLEIKGCVLGFLCGGEMWTRATLDETGKPLAPRKPPARNVSAPVCEPAPR
jgi:uncharacterized protein (DUF2147 family)